jgi:hypothetical protein
VPEWEPARRPTLRSTRALGGGLDFIQRGLHEGLAVRHYHVGRAVGRSCLRTCAGATGENQYSGDLYVALQRTLYVQWGPPNIGAILEPAAIVATGILAYLVRRQRRALWLTLVTAVVLLLAFPVVFFWLVAPANAAFRGGIGDPLPANWSTMRDHWELGHMLRFGLQLVGVGALVASVVWRAPERAGDA